VGQKAYSPGIAVKQNSTINAKNLFNRRLNQATLAEKIQGQPSQPIPKQVSQLNAQNVPTSKTTTPEKRQNKNQIIDERLFD
jgi:hypothetical protein